MGNSKPIRIMDMRGTYKGGGGPDKTVLLSAKLHDPRRVYVLVTYLRDPRDKEYDIHRRAAELGINYVDVPDRWLLDLRCILSLSRLIAKQRIDLLHAHDDKTLLYGWMLGKVHKGLRTMYTCHSHAVYERSDFRSFIAYLKFLARRQVRLFLMGGYQKPILTVSEESKDRIVRDGLRGEDIEVLPNGIDFEYWKREKGTPVLKEELHVGESGRLVGTVARIDYDKDLPTFYRIVRRVAQTSPEVKFVIVGDGYGNELERARARACEMGLNGHLFFTGHRTDMLDVYTSLDIFLMTSLSEGMPNTVLEAMSMGVPVVSTAVGGVPELVRHRETGYLANIGDDRNLSSFVLELTGNSELRGRLAHASRRRIEEYFSFAERVRKLERYYEHLACRSPLPSLSRGRARVRVQKG